MDAIETFARHVVESRFEDLDETARAATRTFLLDGLGVAVAGSAGPWVRELIESQHLWGRGEDATVWISGERLPAPAAAMVNAYQQHNSEYDAVHEAAVVHALTVVLPVAMVEVERGHREGRPVSGRDFLLALALGVDVAAGLGVAATSTMRFFRPGTAGGFGGVAAMGRLRGFDAATLVNAFSALYGQLGGSMQAHSEGSMLLAMQIGFNARNAVVACDLAARGLEGPKQVLEGPFGFFNLIEPAHRLPEILPTLGRIWRIAEMAHKPYPSGRATHGVLDAVLALQQRLNLASEDIASVRCAVPPLTYGLVGRPVRDDMAPNYARLCARYVAALALVRRGRIEVADFASPDRFDPDALALARRIEIDADENPDVNALAPVTVALATHDGRHDRETVSEVYGSPARPMSREAHLDKFRRNCTGASRPLTPERQERLIETVDELETLEDAADLVRLMRA